ncbi:MAG TPA: FAD-dependent monooxygenase, partial [Ilumatobacteraceae bacterium]|nr:FAD-dependent monooxygenase [Ilumatobacteraceae bacterium]
AGVRDAANLAWKLDLVRRGIAPDTLLDTYQSERLPSARAAIEFSIELGKVICVPDPAEAAARDAAMAAAVDGIAAAPGLPDITTGLIHPTAPHAGTQLVQGRVDGRLADDVHGNGWRLVLHGIDVDDLGDEEREWFASFGAVLALTQPDPVFDRWFADHATGCALQRPDFYLYGTAPDAATATALLADLRRELTS